MKLSLASFLIPLSISSCLLFAESNGQNRTLVAAAHAEHPEEEEQVDPQEDLTQISPATASQETVKSTPQQTVVEKKVEDKKWKPRLPDLSTLDSYHKTFFGAGDRKLGTISTDGKLPPDQVGKMWLLDEKGKGYWGWVRTDSQGQLSAITKQMIEDKKISVEGAKLGTYAGDTTLYVLNYETWSDGQSYAVWRSKDDIAKGGTAYKSTIPAYYAKTHSIHPQETGTDAQSPTQASAFCTGKL